MSAPPPPYPGEKENPGNNESNPQEGYNAPYPPAGEGGYPQAGAPQGQYPPQGQGYPPPQGQGYPPPQGQGYPPQQGQGYPQGGQGYPAGYAPPQQQGGVMIVQSQPQIIVQRYTEHSQQVTCPNCHQQIVSSVTYECGALAWLLCIGLFFFGLSLGCCLIPFCIDGCKDAIHSCPSCHVTLGRYKRL